MNRCRVRILAFVLSAVMSQLAIAAPSSVSANVTPSATMLLDCPIEFARLLILPDARPVRVPVLALTEDASSVWRRTLSNEQNQRLTRRLANDADLRADYDQIGASLTETSVPSKLRDEFMANLNKAISHLDEDEILNVQTYTDVARRFATAPANSKAAKAAARELKIQSDLLRYINGQSGKTFREKLDGFVALVSLKLKRVSTTEATQLKGCILRSNKVTAEAATPPALERCWQPQS